MSKLTGAGKTAGVLALQGGVSEHAELLQTLGADVVLVKKASQLEGLDALVLPGGESSTIDRLTRILGLRDALIETISGGLPTLGTCAGLIMLSREITDPAPGQQSLGLLNVTVDRNAFGSQVASAETVLDWKSPSSKSRPVKAAFIRAPRIVSAGEGVDVTAHYNGEIVGVRQNNLLGISFHPELCDETAVHEELLGLVK